MKNLQEIFYKLKLLFLLIFVFSLGFEYWDPLGLRSSFTVTRFFGLLYALFSLSDLSNFRLTKHNRALVIAVIILCLWIVIVNLFNISFIVSTPDLGWGIIQVCVLFWLVLNDVHRASKLREKIYLVFILGISLVGILITFGIGVETVSGQSSQDLENFRAYFMGMNPNRMGALAAIAFLMNLFLLFSPYTTKRKKMLLIPIIFILLWIVGITGSRGAFFMILIGVGTYFGLKKGNLLNKVVYFISGCIFLYFLIEFFGKFELLQKRLLTTYEEGDTGSRIKLWTAGFEIFLDNPLLGLGLDGFKYALKTRTGNATAHNVFIDFALIGGIVALGFFSYIIKIILFSCVRVFKQVGNPGYLMIFLPLIFNLMKSGGAYESKMSWLILATLVPINYINPLKQN